MKFQGETGKVLKIKLPSAIIKSSWGANEVAVSGRVMLEVKTIWVSDGSDILINLKNAQGNLIEVLKGNIYYNCFRTQYLVAKANTTGGMFFEAEMKAHGLKSVSTKIIVLPVVTLKNLKWFDGKIEKELTESEDGVIIACEGKVEGAKSGSEAYAIIRLQLGEHKLIDMLNIKTIVTEGKIQFKWKTPFPKDIREIQIQTDLEKEGGKYFEPAYIFEIGTMGVSAVSKPLKIIQHMFLTYEFSPGDAGKFEGKKIKVTAPDGTVKDYSIPKDGKIDVPKTMVGEYVVDNTQVEELL